MTEESITPLYTETPNKTGYHGMGPGKGAVRSIPGARKKQAGIRPVLSGEYVSKDGSEDYSEYALCDVKRKGTLSRCGIVSNSKIKMYKRTHMTVLKESDSELSVASHR